MSGGGGSDTSGGVPGILGLAPTNLFSFGPELDQINSNIAAILVDRVRSDAMIENIATTQATAFADFSRQLEAINMTVVQAVQLLQAVMLGITDGAALINTVLERLGGPGGPATTVGLDPSNVATEHQTPPTKSGP